MEAGLIRVCYNGIDLEQFHPAPAARPPEVSPGAFLIGSASMLRPEKGLGTLIDAFARVRDLHRPMKLVLVGGGPEYEALQARARQAGVFEDCIWQPATPKVAEWLRKFDVFVLPSLNEALSNSIMEAMACGLPVIASDVGGNPELIVHGVRGLLFKSQDASGLADALAKLIADEPLRRSLGAAGQRFIEAGFSRQTSASRMGEIYESFLERR